MPEILVGKVLKSRTNHDFKTLVLYQLYNQVYFYDMTGQLAFLYEKEIDSNFYILNDK